MSLAVCLAGGGVKGAAHIGVLKAIEEENLEYDYITGTSSGSIVASLNAMGYNSDEIYKLFKKYSKKIRCIDFKNVMKFLVGVIVKGTIIIDGLNSGDLIEKSITEAAKVKEICNINQIKKNVIIPSVDLNSGGLYIFSNMEKRGRFLDDIKYINSIGIGKAVRASCSYPGVFSPCEYKDTELIDGGIRENLPWKTAKLCGADKVFCIKFQSEKELKKNKNIIDIVSKSISILCHELSNYELDGADYLLTLKTENIALLDYSKIDELYELGYKEGKKFLQNNKI